jgi:hypothetical protein
MKSISNPNRGQVKQLICKIEMINLADSLRDIASLLDKIEKDGYSPSHIDISKDFVLNMTIATITVKDRRWYLPT